MHVMSALVHFQLIFTFQGKPLKELDTVLLPTLLSLVTVY